MSATNDKPIPTDAAVIVFGTAKGSKLAQAGWFRAKDFEAATAAALKFGLSILHADTDAVRAILPALREVRVKPGEQVTIPVIDSSMLQKLTALHKEAAKLVPGLQVPVLGGSSAAKAPPAGLALWNALKVGDLILAADLDRRGIPGGWYEAVIIAVDGDTFIVKFRDYPEEGKIKRLRHHIALLCPQG